MKFFLFVLTTLFIYDSSKAQNKEWIIPAGEDIKNFLGDSIIFRYPQFTQGFVYFRDETISNALLNLNLINGEMQFIAPSKDTMTVTNEGTIKYITINKDTFYYDKGFVELVHSNAGAKLAKIDIIKPVALKKTGAYGQSSSASAISTVSSFYNNSNQFTKLTENKEVTLRKETIYFIGNNFNKFLPAFKKNIYELFNEKEPGIESFIKDEKIKLNKKDDLIKLVDFIGKEQAE
jgi:hypothetical protein